jgi:hypothetical protein
MIIYYFIVSLYPEELRLHFTTIKKWNPAKTTTIMTEKRTNRNKTAAAKRTAR